MVAGGSGVPVLRGRSVSNFRYVGVSVNSSSEMAGASYTLIELTINETTYTVENRIYLDADGELVSQYRVFLGATLVKDWTQGNFVRYVDPDGPAAALH